jgi:hypothetical protein
MTTAPDQVRRLQLGEVVAFLQRREQLLWIKSLSAIVGGFILTAAGVLALNGIVCIISASVSANPVSFWPTLPIVAGISLPLSFIVGVVVRSGLFNPYREENLQPGHPRRNRPSIFLIILDFVIIGPRLILYGLGRRRGRKSVGKIDMNRAALAVMVLEGAKEHVSPAKLLQPDDADGVLGIVLEFLFFHDIAAISATGEQVWLKSEARAELM